MKKQIIKLLDEEFLSHQKELDKSDIKLLAPHERRLFFCLSLCELWLSHTLENSEWCDKKYSINFQREKNRVLFRAVFNKSNRRKIKA